MPIVRAKNEAVELGLTWAHNLFILWAGVPALGRFQHRDSIEFPFPLDHSLLSFSHCFLNLSTPFPPLTSHIYSSKLVVRL